MGYCKIQFERAGQLSIPIPKITTWILASSLISFDTHTTI